MRKFLLFFLFVLSALRGAGFSGTGRLWAEEDIWYRSNKSGLAMERLFSRLAALRGEYALRVRNISLREMPELLRSYYNAAYLIEERILYEKGEEVRRQWIFRDQRGATRLNASFTQGFFSSWNKYNEEDEPDAKDSGKSRSGFIEIYNQDRYITEERIFARDGSESLIQFYYSNNILIRAEMRLWFDPPESDEEMPGGDFVLQAVDYYRYTRSSSLRAVERVYHTAVPEDKNRFRVSFPALNMRNTPAIDFDRQHASYNVGSQEDLGILQGDKVTYITDSRVRVLREIHRDEEDNIIAEVENTWKEDRLAVVRITAEGKERVFEFDYDSEGKRIMERNYNNGILERTVRSQENRDIEELYMNGAAVLRAVWEDGKKISEERIRPSGGGAPR
ncbi:MAG: hypothetical protein LBH43_00220 [Treponema sp.]|nr:hypothetical protein [Treponema sp.]